MLKKYTDSEVKEWLAKVQNFDASSLTRESELGTHMNFKDAVAPAQRLIDFYRYLSLEVIQDLPEETLNKIIKTAESIHRVFGKILQFDPRQRSPADRDGLINQLKEGYDSVFKTLYPYVSYSLLRSMDLRKIGTEARTILRETEDTKTKAEATLGEIREVAAEQGVTQQAVYFKEEYDLHMKEAQKWQRYILVLAVILGSLAIFGLFLHKMPLLKPEDFYDTVQLAISKFLIFFIIAYLLFLSAKNFLNHKHNAIVNKHRQNALMTYTAIVEASDDQGVRDAVLLEAARCIFSPQSTGYAATPDGNSSHQRSILEVLSKPASNILNKGDK